MKKNILSFFVLMLSLGFSVKASNISSGIVSSSSVPNVSLCINVPLSFVYLDCAERVFEIHDTTFLKDNLFSGQPSKDMASIKWKNQARDGNRPLRILAVGNSWTKNATVYLKKITDDLGLDIELSRLYYSNAPMRLFAENLATDEKKFTLDKRTRESVRFKDFGKHSFKEALSTDTFDIVVLQQAGYESDNYDNYQPHLDNLINYIDSCSAIMPDIYFFSVWSYPDYCKSKKFFLHSLSSSEMYEKALSAWNLAVEHTKIANIIPVSPVIKMTREMEGIKYVDKEDGLHLSYTGAYAAACTWCATLLRYFYSDTYIDNKTIKDCSFEIPAYLDSVKSSAIRSISDSVVNNVNIYYPAINTIKENACRDLELKVGEVKKYYPYLTDDELSVISAAVDASNLKWNHIWEYENAIVRTDEILLFVKEFLQGESRLKKDSVE